MTVSSGTAPPSDSEQQDCEHNHKLPRPTLGAEPRPSTAPGLGVCEWSPEGLYDKNVSLIPNTDEILKFMKKK